MLDADELQLAHFDLLEVDNYHSYLQMLEIRLAVTGTDVIHRFCSNQV